MSHDSESQSVKLYTRVPCHIQCDTPKLASIAELATGSLLPLDYLNFQRGGTVQAAAPLYGCMANQARQEPFTFVELCSSSLLEPIASFLTLPEAASLQQLCRAIRDAGLDPVSFTSTNFTLGARHKEERSGALARHAQRLPPLKSLRVLQARLVEAVDLLTAAKQLGRPGIESLAIDAHPPMFDESRARKSQAQNMSQCAAWGPAFADAVSAELFVRLHTLSMVLRVVPEGVQTSPFACLAKGLSRATIPVLRRLKVSLDGVTYEEGWASAMARFWEGIGVSRLESIDIGVGTKGLWDHFATQVKRDGMHDLRVLKIRGGLCEGLGGVRTDVSELIADGYMSRLSRLELCGGCGLQLRGLDSVLDALGKGCKGLNELIITDIVGQNGWRCLDRLATGASNMSELRSVSAAPSRAAALHPCPAIPFLPSLVQHMVRLDLRQWPLSFSALRFLTGDWRRAGAGALEELWLSCVWTKIDPWQSDYVVDDFIDMLVESCAPHLHTLVFRLEPWRGDETGKWPVVDVGRVRKRLEEVRKAVEEVALAKGDQRPRRFTLEVVS